MYIHEESGFFIHFGDASSCSVPPKTPEFKVYCNQFLDEHNLPNLILQNQVHGSHGANYSNLPEEQHGVPILFEKDGDFLVSSSPRIAVGVLTADCLPVVFYDKINKIVAVAHAGWPGSVLKISQNVVNHLKLNYGTNVKSLSVFFGPSARSCCYEVQESFCEKLNDFSYKNQVLEYRDDKIFFDLPKFNILQLLEVGLSEDQINLDYNHCTICNPNFHSYRRNNFSPNRQPTVAWLK